MILTKKLLTAFIFLIHAAVLYPQQPKRQNQRVQGQGHAGNKGMSNPNPGTVKQMIDEFKKINAEFDSTDFEYAILLNDNAGLFASRQTAKGKEIFFKRVSQLASVIYRAGLSEQTLAKMNYEIGRTSYAVGRFVFAAKRFTEAKDRFEKNNAMDDDNYLQALSGLGLVYISAGRLQKADSVLAPVIAMREKRFGAQDPGLIPLLNNKAVLDFNLGRYNESEAGFNKAIGLLQGQLSSMAYAIVLNNQAMLFQSLGRNDEAKNNLLKAIDIAKNLEISRARTHLRFYANLALLYQRMSLFDEAERIYHILENKYEKGVTEFANLLNNLAILLIVKGKDERVETMLKNSARIFKLNLSENSLPYAKVINDLGNYYRIKGLNDSATLYLERSLQIHRKLLGRKHPLYIQNEEDLAILYWKKKEWPKAMQFYNEVMERTIDFVNTYFVAMSEAEKSRYWDMLSPRFLRGFNFLLEASQYDDKAIPALFRFRVATKGVLLNSARKITESILASGDEQLIHEYSNWIDIKEQLATFYAYSIEELKEQNINIDSLENVANSIEKKLSAHSKEFTNSNFIRRLTIWDIRSGLKPNEAILEIIRLRYYDQNFTDSCRYIGLIVTKQDPRPKLVVLSNGPALENSASKYYQQAIKKKSVDERSYNYFWAPFDTAFRGRSKIFISPDGVYNQINLNTLKKTGDDYLIRKNEFVLLGSPGEVLADSTRIKKEIFKNATLIGNPDFGSERIPELPGTQIEVDSIHYVLRSSGYKVAKFSEKNATETNLKRSKKVMVLHIATHGYFLQDVVKIYWPIGVAEENAKNNVLLRSGLLLAGAADADKLKTGLDSANNGVLTSYEAMNLDLSGTSLVVLSACETGLGEIKAGEGVYGLQRAFLEAGAEALIMSLWKVDDAATQQLMNNFYHNWIKTGDKQKAFRQAQLQLMEKYPAPYYWGAFVMMGN